MRIALLSLAVPWRHKPTIGLYNVAQAAALRQLGHDAEIFTIAPWIPALARNASEVTRRQSDRPARYEWGGVPINTVRAPMAYPRAVRFGPARSHPRAVARIFDRATAPFLAPMIDRFAPDALLAHGMQPWGGLARRLAKPRGLRCGVIEHSYEDVMAIQAGSSMADHYLEIARSMDVVLSVSDAMTSNLRQIGVERASTLLGGVNCPPRPGSHDRRSDTFDILCAGQYHERKGHALLLKAFARANLSNAQLRLVGTPPAALKALIHDLGIADRIEVLSEMPNADLLSEMAKADLFALPSWAEAFGLVFAEALGVGTPVLMTEDAGFAEHIEHGRHGWIVQPRDIAATVVALRAAHRTSPKQRREMGRRGKALIQSKFVWRKNAQRLVEYFEAAAPALTSSSKPIALTA